MRGDRQSGEEMASDQITRKAWHFGAPALQHHWPKNLQGKGAELAAAGRLACPVGVRQKYHKLSQQKVAITLRFVVRPVRPSSRTPTRQLFWPCIVEASWPTKCDPPKCSGFGNQVRSNERTQVPLIPLQPLMGSKVWCHRCHTTRNLSGSSDQNVLKEFHWQTSQGITN